MGDRRLASLLANPTAWFVFQFVEFLIVVWLVRETVPSSWPVVADVAIILAAVVALTFVNLRLRRRFPAG